MHQLPFFFIGMAGYLIHTKQGKPYLNILALSLIFPLVLVNFSSDAVIISLSTILIILFYKQPISKVLQLPGKISYSVYLIHFPLGIKFLNLLKPRMNENQHWMLFLLSFALVFTFGWLLYRLLELPSEKASQKIKYADSKQRNDHPSTLLTDGVLESQALP